MFRTLIIIAAAVLVFLIIKNRLNGKSLKQKNAHSTKTDVMVKCLQCGTYIPKKEAIISGTDKFCCQQHQRDWEKGHSDRD
jgi:ribosomal protein S26